MTVIDPPSNLEVTAKLLADHLNTLKHIHYVKDLMVSLRENKTIVLSGKCTKFYHKQIVQEMAKEFLEKRVLIVNEISVVNN